MVITVRMRCCRPQGKCTISKVCRVPYGVGLSKSVSCLQEFFMEEALESVHTL